MFNLVEKRRWYFLLSALIIVPGLLIMGYSWRTTGAPFRLSIDFLGGTIYNISFIGGDVNEDQIRGIFEADGEVNPIIQELGTRQLRWILSNPSTVLTSSDAIRSALQETFSAAALEGNLRVSYTEGSGYLLYFDNADLNANEALIRSTFSTFIGETSNLASVEVSSWSIRASFKETEAERQVLESALATLAPIDKGSYTLEAVSGTIGREVTNSALLAVLAAAFVITGFMVIAFRQVPNAFRYGVSAISAMIHDILVVMGVMSLMGLLLGWEVDSLFLTAVLTVVGFSVQDTIVVFDRIRENIPLHLGESYETIVNRSLWETMHRSLATQLNAFFIMVALLIFGGETVQHFIFILFIGLLTGSYSSLFTAVPMLVSWEKGEIPFVNQNNRYKKENVATA